MRIRLRDGPGDISRVQQSRAERQLDWEGDNVIADITNLTLQVGTAWEGNRPDLLPGYKLKHQFAYFHVPDKNVQIKIMSLPQKAFGAIQIRTPGLLIHSPGTGSRIIVAVGISRGW